MTLNNIISNIELIVVNHKQIKTFVIGLRDDFLANGDIQYPAFFLELQKSTISRTNKKTTYSFTAIIADLSQVAANSDENQIEVESDLTSIAEDILAQMQYISDGNKDFQSSTDLNIDYFPNTMEDIVTAIGFTFDVATRYAANRCQVPSTFEMPNLPLSPYIVNNYSFRNAIERDRFTISSLANKEILLILVDGETFKQVVTPNLAIDEYNYNASTGEFIFGRTINLDQIVQILNRGK